jgi:hypothetical protein
MGLFKRRAPRPELPSTVAAALELAKGERVLAFGVDDLTGGYVIATAYGLAVVTLAVVPSNANADVAASGATGPVVSTIAERTLRRRWLSVDAGAWDPETATLIVTWADGGRGVQWSFRGQQTRLPETLRERVQASVVIATRLTLGDRRSGRVAIRQDFATRELIEQTILGRYTRADDPEVQAHVEAALAHLRDQVGLPA